MARQNIIRILVSTRIYNHQSLKYVEIFKLYNVLLWYKTFASSREKICSSSRIRMWLVYLLAVTFYTRYLYKNVFDFFVSYFSLSFFSKFYIICVQCLHRIHVILLYTVAEYLIYNIYFSYFIIVCQIHLTQKDEYTELKSSFFICRV